MSSDPLPAAVQDLAERMGATRCKGKTISLTQHGRMRSDGRSGWMRFRARQTISLTSCAFRWKARTGPGGLVSVLDSFENGAGRLNVTALGFIPIADVRDSPDATRGEMMRYLAELAWAPPAIVLNRNLRWRDPGGGRLSVAVDLSGSSAEVELRLDGEGRVGEAISPNRPRAVGRGFVETPWRGRFTDYRQVGEVWIPFAGEVAWLGGEDEVVWQGRIDSWKVS